MPASIDDDDSLPTTPSRRRRSLRTCLINIQCLLERNASFAASTCLSTLVSQGRGVLGRRQLLKLPCAAADGAPLLRLRVEPAGDALQVKRVSALAPDHGGFVAGELGIGRARVERDAADAAHVVLVTGVPRPHPDRLLFVEFRVGARSEVSARASGRGAEHGTGRAVAPATCGCSSRAPSRSPRPRRRPCSSERATVLRRVRLVV